jgi:DNA-binding HxlR family transcriptional regulator
VVASAEAEAGGDARSREAEGAVAHVHETWAIEAAAAVLCRRWKPSILWALGAGPRRYNALAAALPHVTPKVLTEQLRELTRDGLVTRTAHRYGPKHVEYALTAAGTQMLSTLEAMDAWGRAWAGGAPR